MVSVLVLDGLGFGFGTGIKRAVSALVIGVCGFMVRSGLGVCGTAFAFRESGGQAAVFVASHSVVISW
jgi:hypothetical protein